MKGLERRVHALEGPADHFLTLEEALRRLDDPDAYPGKVYSPAFVAGLRDLAEVE